MNVTTANKLVTLRKSFGYSQEDLAAKLGVSRQAVSKWERAESSPDTDNLIALAGLYNMTVDDIINDEIEVQHKAHVDKKISKDFLIKKMLPSLIIGTMIATIGFFIVGFAFNGWAYAWVCFLLIPIFQFAPFLFYKSE